VNNAPICLIAFYFNVFNFTFLWFFGYTAEVRH
jgi:hypothetical protein